MIDLDAVSAIDVHTHVEVSRDGHDPIPPKLREASQKYFRDGGGTPTIDDVGTYYRERKMAAVVFTVDWESQSGRPPVPNEEVLEGAARVLRRPDPLRERRPGPPRRAPNAPAG